MAQWVGVQDQPKVAKKKQKHPHLWRIPQKNPYWKRKKFFFSILTRRLAESAEGLNSSLAGEL